MMRDNDFSSLGDAQINLQPVNFSGEASSEDARKQLLELQMKMATCSINHEYARLEFEALENVQRKEDLLDFMHDCRCQYFEARSELVNFDPYALDDFEKQLMRQKQMTFTNYSDA